MASEEVEASRPFVYIGEKYRNTFLEQLISLRKDEVLTDFIVRAKHVAIPCHKVVLAAASPYFQRMFHSRSDRCSSNTESFNDISPWMMETIVNLFYTATIEICSESVQEMCQVCDQFELDDLKKACDKYMSEQVGPSNCFGLFEFAKRNDLGLTSGTTLKYMLVGLGDILRLSLQPEYKALNETELIEYISKDELEVEDEAQVFELVDKWIRADQEKRESSFVNILPHVRLPLCSPSYLCDVVETSPFMEPKSCQKLLSEAKNYHLLPERRHMANDTRTKPRQSSLKPPLNRSIRSAKTNVRPLREPTQILPTALDSQLRHYDGKKGLTKHSGADLSRFWV